MNNKLRFLIIALLQFLTIAVVIIGFSSNAFSFPRIFTNDPAFAGTYYTATIEGITANDRINESGVVKLVHQLDPNAITDGEYARFLSPRERGTIAVPKSRLIQFCRRTGFGDKRFMNRIANYSHPLVNQNDIRLVAFGEEVCRFAGIPNGTTGFNTTIRLMAGLAVFNNTGYPDPPLFGRRRFAIWNGLPASAHSPNESTALTDEEIFAAHKTEIDAALLNYRLSGLDKQPTPAPVYGKGYIIYLDYDEATDSFIKTIARDGGLTEDDFKISPSVTRDARSNK